MVYSEYYLLCSKSNYWFCKSRRIRLVNSEIGIYDYVLTMKRVLLAISCFFLSLVTFSGITTATLIDDTSPFTDATDDGGADGINTK